MPLGKVRRGEVYLLDLSQQGGVLRKSRPVVVVQNDLGNRFGHETIVAAIRDPHGGRLLPIFVPVAKGDGGLGKDSIVDAGHLVTVAVERLGVRAGVLADATMARLDEALRISLGLA